MEAAISVRNTHVRQPAAQKFDEHDDVLHLSPLRKIDHSRG